MDLVALRYKPVHDKFGDRTIQLIMVVELKTRDSRLQDNPAQVEIFGYLKRFFYNGRGTPTKPAEYDCGIFRSRKIRSELRGTDKILWAMGAHLLEMDGPDPERSVCRSWDGIHVKVEQVASLLRFDLNPFDPGQDLGNEYFRRRHKPHQESLPLTNSA